MQAASDMMLGRYRVTGIDDLERDFYFRQLWDEKGSALIEGMKPRDGGRLRRDLRSDAGSRARPLRGCWHRQRLARHERRA